MGQKTVWRVLARSGLVMFLMGTVGVPRWTWAQGEATVESAGDSFPQAVDLNRHRKGNPEWDTQELITSGLTALHEEHVQILEELRALKAETARLEKRR